jgi:hypothetical protein
LEDLATSIFRVKYVVLIDGPSVGGGSRRCKDMSKLRRKWLNPASVGATGSKRREEKCKKLLYEESGGRPCKRAIMWDS